MLTLIEISNPIFVFAVAFLTTYLIIPKIIWVVNSRDLIDKPDHRSSHKKSTPTMAGVSFFLAIIITVFCIKKYDVDNIGINLIVALTIIFIVGLKDDIVVSTPRAKVGGQLLAIITLLISGIFNLTNFEGFLGIDAIPLIPAIVFSVFLMLAAINSFNLIDGIDGLASIIGIIIFSGYAVLFYLLKLDYYFLISLGFIAVLFAYLRYNFSKSKKIFMGDTGSLIIGFCIAFLSIRFLTIDISTLERLPFLIENRLIVFIAILGIPFFDTLRVIGIRLLDKKSPFSPDRNHIHHILIDSGLKHYKVSLFLAILNIVIIGAIILLSNYFSSYIMLMIILCMFCFLLLFFYKLKKNIKFKNNNLRKFIVFLNLMP